MLKTYNKIRIWIIFVFVLSIVGISPFTSVVLGASETLDLRLFTEVDGLGRYTVNATRVTCTTINNQMSEDIHVYYDWNGNGTSFGNFSVEYEFKTPVTDSNDNGAFCIHLGFANDHGSLGDLLDEQWCGFWISTVGPDYSVYGVIGDWNGGKKQKLTDVLTENTLYYANFSRSGTILNFSIYSDASRTVLVTGAEYTNGQIDEWRYMMVAQSYDYAPNSQSVDSYFTQNYEVTFVENETGFGQININVYDENTSDAVISWELLVTNEDASDDYYNPSTSNPLLVNVYSLPYGDDTVFIFNKTGYSYRVYIIDTDISENLTLNAFLSQEDYTNLYYLTIIDEYNEPIDDAKVTILKFVGGEYQNISILKTNGNGQISAYLQVGIYKIKIEKTGYTTSYANLQTDPDFYGIYYPVVYKLYATDDEIDIVTFTDYVVFRCSWQSNNTLRVYYDDNSLSTLNLTIEVYQNNGTSEVLKNTFSYTYPDGNSRDIYVNGLDYNVSHRIKINVTHSILGTISNYSVFVFPSRNFTIDTTDIEQHLNTAFGDFDIGSYSDTLLIYTPGMFILLGFAAIKHPGIGIMGLAIWSAFAGSKIETTLEGNLFVLFSLLILLGIVAFINKKQGGG